MNSFLHTWQLAWHVVVRNWTVYRKDFLANISPTLADPALLMASLGLGLSAYIGRLQGLTYAQYLAPGMVGTTVLFTAFFECSYGFYVRMSFESVFKAMLTTPVGVREVVLGEFLWVFVRASLMAAGVGLVLLALGVLPNPWSVLLFPLLGGILALPCGAIGLIAAGYVRNINQFQSVYSFLIAPIYFLSGTFFPLGQNELLLRVVQISPFYHGVSLLQMCAWGHFSAREAAYHLAALFVFSVLLGFWSLRQIRKKLIH